MFGLEPDISLTDSPVKPGNDEKEKKPGNDSIIFFPLLPSGLSRGLWDIDDVSEMTGMSKIKIKSIEKGCEERLLRLPLSCLLNICYALDKKLVISLQDMPAEKGIDKLLPA